MIRLATPSDLPAIDRIYNQAIEDRFHTAHLTPLNEEERQTWFQAHNPERYPVYVYRDDGEVVGWASISAYRPGREALDEAAVVSYYIDFDHHGRGIGSGLVNHTLEQCPGLGIHVLFAIIIEGNDASVGLMEKFGFERWGYLPEVIHCHGERRGQIYMGTLIDREHA